MDNRLPIVSAGSEVCLQQPVERRAWCEPHQSNPPADTQDKLTLISLSAPGNTTLYTTHEYTTAKETKKEKSQQFLCKITCLLLSPHVLSRRPNCDPTHYQARPSATEKHCCSFSNPYCDPGLSPLLSSEWGGNQMQFCFFVVFFFKKEEKILIVHLWKTIRQKKKKLMRICGTVYKKKKSGTEK